MKKILVVEDDPLARQILNVRLKPAYEVVVTGDAMSAIIEARKHKPDLIILDLGLPAGGGFSVLQRLKAIPALAVIPVLVVSGLDQATHEKRALEAGANAYLQKTPTNETLITTVRALLGD